MNKKEMKHPCGCITENIKGVIHIFPCKTHRENGKYAWIAIQHIDGG